LQPSSCLVVVPYRDHIEPACEEALRGLEARGYTVRRSVGSAAVDLKQSHLATEALAGPFDEILWVASDTSFHPDAVERLRSHGLPLVGGLSVEPVKGEFACAFLRDTPALTLGEGGSVTEVRHVGTAFLLTHRRVFEDIGRKFDLPACNRTWPTPVVPYFQPLVWSDPELGYQYLGEGYSFCERARQAGHKVMVDTSIRLWRVGPRSYGWEDVLAPIRRVTAATLQVKPE
jgi:hypothetical protein